MYERALAGREKALGAEHSATLMTVNNLGTLYHDQGKLEEAETMYARALGGYTNVLRTEKPPLTALRSFATVLGRSMKATNTNRQISFSRLSRLISLVKERGKEDSLIIQELGRAMVFWNNDESAQVAYSHAVRYIKGQCADFGGLYCSGCRQPITVKMGLHVCRQCADTELCGRCMADYAHDALVLVRCARHTFFDVDMAALAASESMGIGDRAGASAWMDTISDEYNAGERE